MNILRNLCNCFIISHSFVKLELAHFFSFVSAQAVLTIQTTSAISRTTKIQGQMSPSTVAEWIKNSNLVPPKARPSWREPNRIAMAGQSIANDNSAIPLPLPIFVRDYIPMAMPRTLIIPITQIIQSHSFVKFKFIG